MYEKVANICIFEKKVLILQPIYCAYCIVFAHKIWDSTNKIIETN